MNMRISGLLLLICGTLPYAYSNKVHYQVSARSDIFVPVRPTSPPKTITECNIVVSEPYGLLERTFKRGEVKEGASCSWTLRAPPNHVINVILTVFDLQDDIPSEKGLGHTGSTINLYDGADSSKLLDSYAADDKARATSVFTDSISSKQDMLVKIDYRDIKGYATQIAHIKYEFLNVDDMNRLLQAKNVKLKTT